MQTEVKLYDILLWVEYDFRDGEDQTYDYVGSPPTVDLYAIYVAGVDIFDIFSSDQLEQIESEIIKQHIEQ
jgi:hypothetical protein